MQIIKLSACANKLTTIQEHAEEYAALIMESLDPKNIGHIEVYIFFIYGLISFRVQCTLIIQV